MNILITGGCGFIGSNIAIFLKENNPKYTIHSLDNISRNSSKLNFARISEHKIKNFKIDISDEKKIKKLSKYDLIIDCCAEASVEFSKKDTKRVFNTNLLGTFNILEKAKRDKSKIIFLSTSRVYSIKKILDRAKNIYKQNYKFSINEKFSKEGPISLYGFTKLSSENLIHEYSYAFKVKFIINRFGVVSGPWQFGRQDQGFVSLWLWNFINKKKLNYIGFKGSGKQVRDILHVLDLCELIQEQIKNFNVVFNKTFNVGGGIKNSLNLRRLTKICQRITRNKTLIKKIKSTSQYDIPYYVTNNSYLYKFYKWRVKRGLEDIILDTYKVLLSNFKYFKKLDD